MQPEYGNLIFLISSSLWS